MKGSKIFVPVMPTLLHLSTVKVALKLFNEFQIENLDEVYRRMQCGISMTSEDSQHYPNCSNAQSKLLLIPPALRRRVMEAIHGLKSGGELWKEEHERILESDYGKCIFYCDGTIDAVKTAQQLVLNPVIDIKSRFYLACTYCFEEDIRTLWTEMEPLWKVMEKTGRAGNNAARFWVRWLRSGCQLNSQVVAQEDLDISALLSLKVHSFFPAMRPDLRRAFIHALCFVSDNDFRLCLYAMNTDEEEKVLMLWPKRLLLTFLRWPFRDFFLETAPEILKYTNEDQYCLILEHLLSSEINREVFDFYDFFEQFWKCSPILLRERVNNCFPHLRQKIESCLNEMGKKRKAGFDALRSCKH